MKKRIELKKLALPHHDVPDGRPEIASTEYRRRRRALYDAAGCQWVVVYGDREHLGSLVYLCGFDPRFEEALLVMGAGDHSVLMVGAEGRALAEVLVADITVSVSPLLSLPNVLRAHSGRLSTGLRSTGVASGDEVGVVGWKYLEPAEAEGGAFLSTFVPGIVVDALAETGAKVEDVTRLLLDPAQGQRRINSAAQIAQYEWGAARASLSAWRVITAVRPGMSELAACSHMAYAGEPLSCHVMFSSGREEIVGLRSPSDRVIGRGDGVTLAIGYWGGLTCRAGVVSEASENAFFREQVATYMSAIIAWYEALEVGAATGGIVRTVAEELSQGGLKSMLNPGHTTSTEEWLNSPMTEGSEVRLASGMALQCDIIPVGLPAGTILNCEDTVALGDSSFRRELATTYPGLWGRIELRRQFMRQELGIGISDDVLPLSAYPACFAPFWLDADRLCVCSR